LPSELSMRLIRSYAFLFYNKDIIGQEAHNILVCYFTMRVALRGLHEYCAFVIVSGKP
jgi:hypothetical protein